MEIEFRAGEDFLSILQVLFPGGGGKRGKGFETGKELETILKLEIER